MGELFQKAIIAFIGLQIVFYWISSLLLYEYPWINDVILNILTISFISFLFYNFRMSRSFKPYFYLIDQNVDEWDTNKPFPKNINYNLSFECDMLITENNIDYFERNELNEDELENIDDEEEDESNIIKKYSVSIPYTIDLKTNNNNNSNNNVDNDENTPLLIK